MRKCDFQKHAFSSGFVGINYNAGGIYFIHQERWDVICTKFGSLCSYQ